MSADLLWVRLTARGVYHLQPEGERTAPCGVPLRPPVAEMTEAAYRALPDFDRPKLCPACFRAAQAFKKGR